jgi:predicted transcriptional regulator
MKRLVIHADGVKGYTRRALARAHQLDRNELIEPEVTITFEDPLRMTEVLTAGRLRLVKQIKNRATSITALANELKRDLKSVRRDVGKLERAGVVRTREQVNPGHGRIKIVERVARQVTLVANL